MHSVRRPIADGGKLPVFVFPNTLTFYANDQASLKQVLTIHNPYDFDIRFNVYSNAARKYQVAESEGKITRGHCVDIVVRLNEATPANIGVTDNIRILVYEKGGSKYKGKRDVPSTLLASAPQPKHDEDVFESVSTLKGVQKQSEAQTKTKVPVKESPQAPSIFVLIAGIFICVGILLLPGAQDRPMSSFWPEAFSVSNNVKYCGCFALGVIVTIMIQLWFQSSCNLQSSRTD